MPSTLQGAVVVAFAVLPGAIFLWGFEREAGKWGIGLSDQVLRFVAASAVFLAIWAAPLYLLYQRYAYDRVHGSGPSRYVDHLSRGDVPWTLAFVPLAYVAVPAILGSLAGSGSRQRDTKLSKFARVAAGRDPAPRAWDALFAGRPVGLVRIRLKDGSWVGGRFASKSYAAGDPERQQDILLEEAYEMTAGGAFAADADENVKSVGSQLLVRWEEADVLEFFTQGD